MLRYFYKNLTNVYNNLKYNFFPVSILKEKLLEKRLNTIELYSNKNKLINSKIPFNEQWECKDFLKRK